MPRKPVKKAAAPVKAKKPLTPGGTMGLPNPKSKRVHPGSAPKAKKAAKAPQPEPVDPAPVVTPVEVAKDEPNTDEAPSA